MAAGGLVHPFRHPDVGVEVPEEAHLEGPSGDGQVEAEDVGAVDGGRVDPPERVKVPLLVGEDMREGDREVLNWEGLVDARRERRLEGCGAGPGGPADTRLTLHPLHPRAAVRTLVTRVTVLSLGSCSSRCAVSAVLPVCALTPPLVAPTPLLPVQTRNAWPPHITALTLQTFGSKQTLDSR